MEAGADLGIQPFGLEAQYCLRAEKGHIIVGAESEARVTLTDIGMGWMWDREDTASKKVGAPALRACEKQPGRMKLVGFRVDDGQGPPRDGGPRGDGGPRRSGGSRRGGGPRGDGGPRRGGGPPRDGRPRRDGQPPRDGALVVADGAIVGHVCTTRRSEALGWQYGMALVREEHAARGAAILLQEEQKPGQRATFSATVTTPPFYDPTGTRLRA